MRLTMGDLEFLVQTDSSLPLQKKETDTLNSPSKIEFTHFTSVPIIYNFKCDICDKKYHLESCLDDHINIEHNPNIPPPSEWEKKTIVITATPCLKTIWTSKLICG